ncbi:hypothetical protein [Jiangella anatolica]|uniref:Uncharacterized protein n=1 Tax=Jiangella anatolica TaxID=2670374 RepID=A0A2W2C4U7_9ACTN|nr:hypothetical protein [Jiangella anatolica]PZF83229.1 hypothetical protein C1I92_13205 [Jiangella anatolica]
MSRGRKTQADVAQWFRDHGWVHAESIAASLPGKDINGMPGWAPEVKATRDGSLTGALKQAERNTGENETPFVVWRPDGYGEERVGEWIVALRLADFTDLMTQIEFDQGPEMSPEDALNLDTRVLILEAAVKSLVAGRAS